MARLTGDAVVFEESAAGRLRSLYRGYWRSGDPWRRLVFVGLVAGALTGVAWAVGAALAGEVLSLAAVPCALAAVALVDRARGFRSPDRIPLDAVEDVSATRGTRGVTRPRLVITYVEGSRAYRRRVTLPSPYAANGSEAFDRALAAFERRGFSPAGERSRDPSPTREG